MNVKYFPKVDDSIVIIDGKPQKQWKEIPGQTVGMAIAYPTNYDPNKKYPLVMVVHGIGERGAGTLSMLQNFILGFDYNGDGVREGSPLLTLDAQKAVDDYGIIMVVPTYDNFFEPSLVNWTYDFVKSKYSVVDQFMFVGFSYGGGSVLKYITSTAQNADRVAVAIPCAPTDHTTDDSIVRKSNLPTHLFVNTNDPNGPTNINVTKKVVADLNKTATGLEVRFTAFNKNGHGGINEAMTLTPPTAMGGQGIVNINENIYQWYISVLKDGPRLIGSGVITIPPVDPPVDPPIPPVEIELKAVASFKLSDNSFVQDSYNSSVAELRTDGTKSTGYKSAKWLMVEQPEGVSQWHPVITSGGGWITGVIKMPKPGKYKFKLTVYSGDNYTGTSAESYITVNYNSEPVPEKVVLQKVFVPKNNNFVYVYEDGSVETKAQ